MRRAALTVAMLLLASCAREPEAPRPPEPQRRTEAPRPLEPQRQTGVPSQPEPQREPKAPRDVEVTLRRVNDVPGSTAEQREWHLFSIDTKPSPGPASH